MTDEVPYLIAHKVRGKPAFDIAIQMPMEDEIWWIIPTSGHRAYPYWHRDLSEVVDLKGDWESYHKLHPDFDSVPDHYWSPGQTSDLGSERAAAPRFSLASLGLAEPSKISIRRRPIT